MYPALDSESGGIDCFNSLLVLSAVDDVDDADDDEDADDDAWSRHSVSISSMSADTSVCIRRNRRAVTVDSIRRFTVASPGFGARRGTQVTGCLY